MRVAQTARNVLIVLVLAALVAFLPGGGSTANAIAALLSTAILAAFVLIAAKLYREHRVEVFSLGDRWRGVLYGAVAVAIFAMAARQQLFDLGGGGALLWIALLAGCSYCLYLVWRHHREYGI